MSRRVIARASWSVVQSLECRTLLAAGSVDVTFGPSGNGRVNYDYQMVDEKPQAMALRSGDKLIVAGVDQSQAPSEPFYKTYISIQGFTANGGLDSTFIPSDTNIHGGRDGATSVLSLPGGKVLVGGYTETSYQSNNLNFALIRYTADGHYDSTFGSGGLAETAFAGDDEIKAVTLLPDGSVIACGFSDSQIALAKYTTNGTLDTSFGGGTGKVLTPFPFASAATAITQSGTKFIVVGTTIGANQQLDFAMVRYNADGTLDSAFGVGGTDGGGKVTTDVVPTDGYYKDIATSVTVLATGKILVAGTSFVTQTGPTTDFNINEYSLARYNTDGTLDGTFDGDGMKTVLFGSGSHYAAQMAVLANGKILLGGSENLVGDFLITRLNADGTPDLSFNGGSDARVFYDFGEQDNEATAMVLQSTGKIVLAGPVQTNPTFWHNWGLVRFQSDGDLVAPTVVARSHVWQSFANKLTFTFSENVAASLTAGNLTIQLTSGGTTFSPSGFSYDAPTNTATFTLGSLPADGRYRATLSGVTDAAGNAMIADTLDFFVMRGDIDHNGTVNFTDLLKVAQNYQRAGINTFADGDFNGDGLINFADLLLLSQRYNTTLPAVVQTTHAVKTVSHGK